MKRLISIFIFCCVSSFAAETNSPMRDANLARVDKTLQANQKKYDGKENFFVRRGILADRKKQIVTIQAETAEITANSIVEFFLIDETSGHDYESLAIAFTKPSDVRAALEFIGMKAGRTINIREHAFWSKGERVIMHIDGKRAEKYIYDKDENESAPESGMVFTGGIMIPSREDPDIMVYAADAREPSSMASNYNERDSVLDIPRRAPQKTVYGHNLLKPAMVMKAGNFIKITLEPEYKEGKKRVLDLEVQIKNDYGPETTDHGKVSCIIEGKSYTVKELIKYLRGLLENGQDPFVTLKFDDNLTLQSIKTFCTIIVALDTDDGIRIEPPAKDHLYYQAYNPPAHFLNRKERINQPLELFLQKKDGVLSGVLKKYIPTWPEGSMQPDLEEKVFPVNNPQELRKTLDTIEAEIPAILVHAPADSTHGEVMGFVSIGLSSHPLLHIFTVEPPNPTSPQEDRTP